MESLDLLRTKLNIYFVLNTMLWIIKAHVHGVLVFLVFTLFRKEMRDGKEALVQKVEQYKPLIVCFNGKGDFTLLLLLLSPVFCLD